MEHDLRVEQMQTNIQKMQSDSRWETRKFVIQIVVGFAATLGAGAALGNLLTSKASASQPRRSSISSRSSGQAPPPAR